MLNWPLVLLKGAARLMRLGLWLAAGYHYVLLLASLLPTRRQKLGPHLKNSKTRFAIAIPAYNEAAVIGHTVQRLDKLNYPRDRFDIVVVADHCSDNTAEIVRATGGVCLERQDGPRGRKGYALAWLLERIVAESRYDAVVVLDADSRVDPDLLCAFEAAIAAGYQVLQGQHVIANAEDSTYNALAAIDLRLNNRLRNLARSNLGFSCRLMGDAMCFHIDVLARFPWSTFSLTEDIEYGIRLMEAGIHVAYVPEAVSRGEAAGGWQQAEKQRMRWEGGVLDMRRRLAWQLLIKGIKHSRLELVDRGLEMLLPPYSMLSVSAAVVLVLEQMRRSPEKARMVNAVALTGAYATLPLWGLIADRAPAALYRSLLSSPLFVLWRLWIRSITWIRRDAVVWVRTPRKTELEKHHAIQD